VTGFAKPGGFRTGEDWARFGNVQCEACHGMGTQHKVWSEDGQVVAAATCMGCHTATTSPTFRLADYWPHVLHHPPAGLKPLPETPAHRLMREGKAAHGN
jgi:mono/diheme cytochrome c family protein